MDVLAALIAGLVNSTWIRFSSRMDLRMPVTCPETSVGEAGAKGKAIPLESRTIFTCAKPSPPGVDYGELVASIRGWTIRAA
jgi:hypothetical protein